MELKWERTALQSEIPFFFQDSLRGLIVRWHGHFLSIWFWRKRDFIILWEFWKFPLGGANILLPHVQVCSPDCRGQKPLPFSAGSESEISLTSKMCVCACVFAPRRYGIHQFIFYTSFSCLHRRHTTLYYFSPFSHWLRCYFLAFELMRTCHWLNVCW